MCWIAAEKISQFFVYWFLVSEEEFGFLVHMFYSQPSLVYFIYPEDIFSFCHSYFWWALLSPLHSYSTGSLLSFCTRFLFYSFHLRPVLISESMILSTCCRVLVSSLIPRVCSWSLPVIYLLISLPFSMFLHSDLLFFWWFITFFGAYFHIPFYRRFTFFWVLRYALLITLSHFRLYPSVSPTSHLLFHYFLCCLTRYLISLFVLIFLSNRWSSPEDHQNLQPIQEQTDGNQPFFCWYFRDCFWDFRLFL